MQGRVGIVVVSYHNPETTKHYVTKELQKLVTPYTLVVVNVDSTREDSMVLAERCGLCFIDNNSPVEKGSNCFLIWDKDNLGYAKGNNRGVKFLNEIGEFDYLLFSNDDIEIVSPNILEVLINRMQENEDIAAIGPRVIGKDSREQSPHDRYISPYRMIGWRLFPFLRKKRDMPETDKDALPMSRYTYWVSGAFMLVDAVAFSKVGMFDETTFLYFEEPIIAERFALIGKKMYFESTVSIVHYEGESSAKLGNKKKEYERKSRRHYLCTYKRESLLILWLYNKIEP